MTIDFLSYPNTKFVQVNAISLPLKFIDQHIESILECVFLNENHCIVIIISMKFIRKGLTDKKSALFHVIA